MAAAKLNAAKVAAAHARAEADQASFLEREKLAAERRRQEFQNRRVMDNERERNRQRKLDALKGREWDVQKREEDYNPRGGGSQFRRGMHGGVSGYVRRNYDDVRSNDEASFNNNHGHYRGRGRRGRGGRGRGGPRGPRGDHLAPNGTPNEPATASPKSQTSVPVIDNETEFPALPGKAKKEESATKSAATLATEAADSLSSPVTGASWAEQVELSRE